MRRPLRLHDHRPERSSALQEVDAGTLPAPRVAPSMAPPMITRPVWLVEPAQPLRADRREQPLLDGAPLQLLSGPERIEAGWWDEALAGRDYFIAQAADTSLVWIYRLRLASLAADASGWYLHGRFG